MISVVNDKKIPADLENLKYFYPDVISYSDYYPFGMVVPNRNASNDSYRYGYQGQEKDDDIKGEGNSYDFGARIYDSRIGRWLSNDPMESKYPYLSPYNAFENNPIVFKDPDGKDAVITVKGNTITVKSVIYIDNSGKNKINVAQAQKDIMKSWGGNYKDSSGKYNVKFDIVVLEKPKDHTNIFDNTGDMPIFHDWGIDANSVNIIVPKNDNHRSFVRGLGGNYGEWAENQTDGTYAHETGHLFGLADLYHDVHYDLKGYMGGSDQDGKEASLSLVDDPNELMANAESNNKASQRSIDAIVAFALKNSKDGQAVINTKTISDFNKKGLAAPTKAENEKLFELPYGWHFGQAPDDLKKKYDNLQMKKDEPKKKK